MTLATKITLARIFLIIPTVVLYIVGMLEETVYLPLLIVSCVLFADTVSALGKFLDPLADKIVIVVMLFLIVYFRDFELFPYDGLVIALLGGLILTRELTVSVFRAVAASKGLVLAADIYGKVKTVLLDIGVAFLILAGVNEVIMWIGEIVFYLGAVLTVFSGVRYLVKNKHVLADTAKDGGKSAEESASEGSAASGEEAEK